MRAESESLHATQMLGSLLTDTGETKDTGGDHCDVSEEREDGGRKERGVGDAKTGTTY